MNIHTSKEKISSYKKAVEQNAGGKFYTGNLDIMTSNLIDEIQGTKKTLQDRKSVV